jgi:hypothetical protein
MATANLKYERGDTMQQPTQTLNPEFWTYGEHVRTGGDLSGYHVEATDGGIGMVDDATYEDGSSFLVVDTGPWIFGKKVMLPAGIVESVDHDEQTLFVNRTKEEIKDAPEYQDGYFTSEGYRSDLALYYGALGVGVAPTPPDGGTPTV